jgi:hypothetical protein
MTKSRSFSVAAGRSFTLENVVCLAVLALSGIWMKAETAEGALLEGKVMKVDLFHKTTQQSDLAGVSSGDFIVGPGVELEGFGFRAANPPLPALVDIDIADMQILITLVNDQPPAFQEVVRFYDSNNTIPAFDVSINPATNWTGFTPNRLFVNGATQVDVTVSQLSGLQGQQILLDVIPIPEPVAGVLMLLSAASLLACRRRARAMRPA